MHGLESRSLPRVSPFSSINKVGCCESPAQLQDDIRTYITYTMGSTLVYGSPPAMSS